MTACCEEMNLHLSNGEIYLDYDASVRRYGIAYKEAFGGGCQQINFCPWCGARLPKILIDELSTIVFDELNLNGYDDPRLPDEFKTGEWWKKRGL